MADLWSNSLQRLVDRIAGGDVGATAFKKSPFLDRLVKSVKIRSGERIETPLITGASGTATMFTVYGTGDSSVTYAEPDVHVNLVSNWKPGGDTLRLSKIRLAQASGMKDKLYDYVAEEVGVTVNSAKELWANQVINGTSSGTDFDGLAALHTNTGTWLSQTRTQSDALFSSVMDATSTASAYTTGTISGSINTRTITGSGTAFDTNVSPGDKLTISGDTTVYTVRAVVSATSLYVTPKLAAAASGASYSIAHAFSNTTTFGTSGATTYEKLNESYFDIVDGGEEPTLGLCHAKRLSKVVNAIVTNQRYAGRSNEIGLSGTSVMFNNAKIMADNYCKTDRLYWLNEDYWQLFALPGFSTFALDKSSLKDNQDGTRRASLTGELNVVFAVSCQAPNRQGMIYNLND